jgi:hypothetical protein
LSTDKPPKPAPAPAPASRPPLPSLAALKAKGVRVLPPTGRGIIMPGRKPPLVRGTDRTPNTAAGGSVLSRVIRHVVE